MLERSLGRRSEDRIELVVQPLYERAEDFAAHLTIDQDSGLIRHGVRGVVRSAAAEGHRQQLAGP